MKKYFLLAVFSIVALLMPNVDAAAQSQFKKGDLAFNLDYALGCTDYGEGSATNGFSLLGEYGFMNVINEKGTISAGIILGAGFANEDYIWGETKFSRIRIGTRGTLHYSFIPQLDTYGGLNFLFVDIEKWKVENNEETEEEKTSGEFVAPSLVAGARYMFCSNVGVNVEFSWDRFQHIGVGFTFKF